MRFLVRLVPKGEGRRAATDTARAVAKTLGVDARNPKWTSYGGLELDLFAPPRGYVDLFLAAITPIMAVEFLRDLNEAPPHRTDEEALDDARALFNSERYWECHEVLEGLWRTKDGQEKRLLQGVILICAAYVHHQKGHEEVALGVLRRGVGALQDATQRYGPLDVEKLAENSSLMLKRGALVVFRI